jgi:1-pyrroline-5-carboxylate dehydrogenase
VQPFGGFGMIGTDSKAGGPDYLLLHMLAKTVVERFR